MDFMQEDLQEVYGYLMGYDYVCRECVYEQFNGDMETFFSNDPIPVTLRELLEEGYQCIAHEE